jgi:hypothetical protein
MQYELFAPRKIKVAPIVLRMDKAIVQLLKAKDLAE